MCVACLWLALPVRNINSSGSFIMEDIEDDGAVPILHSILCEEIHCGSGIYISHPIGFGHMCADK